MLKVTAPLKVDQIFIDMGLPFMYKPVTIDGKARHLYCVTLHDDYWQRPDGIEQEIIQKCTKYEPIGTQSKFDIRIIPEIRLPDFLNPDFK